MATLNPEVQRLDGVLHQLKLRDEPRRLLQIIIWKAEKC